MTIELSYRYSHLDKRHEFGIIFNDVREFGQPYTRWVYYFLGAIFGERKIIIYPFHLDGSKTLKVYKDVGDSKKHAKWIAARINKIINQKGGIECQT